MKISVRVKPNSQKEFVKKENGEYIVAVKAPAKEGKANEAVIKALAEYFGISKSKIQILSGHTSHRKLLQIFL